MHQPSEVSSTSSPSSPLAILTTDGLASLAYQQEQGVHHLRFEAKAGLHQLSILADARTFDWDELYFDLHQFNNTGQRTGPWDFSLVDKAGKKNPPLVPAYWVKLDGRDLGLWYFQRISLDDLAARRFRGHMAFDITQAGSHELQLTPYRAFDICWVSVRLEVDPQDTLIPWQPQRTDGTHPLAAWRDKAFWDTQRQRLATTHQAYGHVLQRQLPAVTQTEQGQPDHLLLLVAAHWLYDDTAAMDRALAIIDEALALPAWGNPSPDGYGHNGDMGAARVLRSMAWAHHLLSDDQMTASRRQRLLDRLDMQMQCFYELSLLHRDYWGGSLLQDHGWRSMADFATAALSLHGVLPGADRWVAYALPRLRRALAAMPRDGAIPPSSYNSLLLYVREMTLARDTLLALGGHDLYDDGPFHPIVGYMADLIREDEPIMLLSPDQQGGRVMQNYGVTFFNHMAAKYRDGRAAHLSQHLLQGMGRASADGPDSPARLWRDKPEHVIATQQDVLWGLLAHDATVTPQPPSRPPVSLRHFEDSGFVHYHDQAQDLTVALRCGPWSGWHADRKATGPCDRLGAMPAAGHFVLYRQTTQLLANVDSTYALRTNVRNVMLVDDQGQIGDIDYPMSIPSFRHPGHEVEWARLDEAQSRGAVRLNLAPAYERSLGVASYTRELLFRPAHERRVICRDHVVLDRPRRLSWLFHGRRDWGVKLVSPLRARLGDEPSLSIEPSSVGLDLTAQVRPTEVVYGYSSAFNTFDHVRYDTQSPVSALAVDFIFSW